MRSSSYWLDLPYAPRPSLSENLTTDVLIIGGGLTGVSAAYHCAKQGLKTTLIEREVIASGSAGKNGGMVVEGTEIDFATALGDDLSRQAWLTTIQARHYTVELIEKHEIKCDLSQPGSLYAAQTENDVVSIEKEFQARQKHGIPCQLIPPGQQLRPSPFKTALFNPADCLLHPVKFIRGLASITENFGAKIYEHTEAVTIDEHTVTTPTSTITAEKVVLSTESYNTGVGEVGCDIERSHALLTGPLSDAQMAELDWQQGGMLWGSGPNYSSVRKLDNRLFIIQQMGLRTVDKADLFNLLLTFFPTLKRHEVNVSHNWECNMLMPQRKRLFIGERNGHYEIFGHGGNGLTQGIMAGKIIAEFFNGKEIPLSYRF